MDDHTNRGASGLAVLGRVVAGLVGGFIGFYAGLFLMLSLFGLEMPDASAAAMVGGAALFGTAAAALVAGLPFARIAVFAGGALVVGLLAGIINELTVDDFEVAIVSAALIVICAAWLTTRFDDQ